MPIPVPLLESPVFLLVALIAGRATRDDALVHLADRRLAALGIHVTFAHDPDSSGKAVAGAR